MPTERIATFDIWRPRYGNALVTVLVANTQTPANIWADEALTIALDNPQRLLTLSQDGIQYGKWAQPVYTGVDYELDIDGADQTGVERIGITSLAGENASAATVLPTGGTVATPLAGIMSRRIHAEDYGEMSDTVSATTNATLVAAIGAAAADGGGIVELPEGTFPFTSLTLSAGVVLEGRGRGITTLESQTADKVITLGGNRAGLAGLTLDGVSKIAASEGVYALLKHETVFDDAEIKRFETGLHSQGGSRARWRDLYLENCATGAKLHGDLDSGGGGLGGEFSDNEWLGGLVTNCTTLGVDLQYVDALCRHNALRGVGFEDNTGTALQLLGARLSASPGCWWKGNTVNLAIDDATPDNDDNTVIGAYFPDTRFDGGTMQFGGTCQNVIFERHELLGVAITLSLPEFPIMSIDGREDSSVTIAGTGDKWNRWAHRDHGTVVGTTTDASATKAWGYEIAPGQVIIAEAHVIGNQTNGENTAEYHVEVSAERPASTLAYDTQTVDFTLGAILTGGTSGATALIVADADGGATGTLSLRKISGEFVDNEEITDSSGGAALANGVLVPVNVALLGAVTAIRAAREDVAGWNATFVANGPELELQVTGAAATNIDWLAKIEVTG